MRASISFLSQDPVLTYSLIAALFLGAVALITGIMQLDFVAVLQPQGLLAVVVSVFAGIVLMVLAGGLEYLVAQLPWVWVQDLLQPRSPLTNILTSSWRLPLYVVALAYGPSAGLVSAGLFAAFAASTGPPSWLEVIFAFELVVVGWLAIAPSPYKHGWAASFNILLAHLLTTITAGFALLQGQYGEITLTGLWELQGEALGGVLLSAFAVSYLGPVVYMRLFATSRIRPKQPTHTVHMPLPPLLESPPPIQRDNIVTSSAMPSSQTTDNLEQPVQPSPQPVLAAQTRPAPVAQNGERQLGSTSFLDLDRSGS
jgi:hypothetical protein